MELIVGLCVGVVFFLCTISAYILGLGHGKQLGNNKVPVINLNPVKAIIEQAKGEKEEKKIDDELTDIMEYSRESALEAIKKAR